MSDDSSTRIVSALRSWIAAAAPGARLPSTRELTAQYGASPVTVQKALRALATLGLIETRSGVGTFVRAAPMVRPHDYGWQTAALGAANPRISPTASPLLMADNTAIALHSGYPDRELLPERLVRAALTRAARSPAVLTRAPAAGLPELQAWFAAEIGAVTAAGIAGPAPGDVLVLPGSQGALSTIFRALAGPGRPVVVESPTYWGAMAAASQAGVPLVPVPSGSSGPDPDELDRAFTATGARVFFAQPTFANPTGAWWSTELGDRILAVVRRHNAFLVEDDWAHDFGLTAKPVPLVARDDGGHVIYIRSLTKSVSPAIRVAGLIARGPARERLLADTWAHTMYVSPILQLAAHDVVTAPAWRTHLRGVHQLLLARRDALLAAVHRHLPGAHVDAVPAGGLNLWVRLPDGTDVARLTARCQAAGVYVGAGDDWFPAEPAGPYLRLNYAGPNPGAYDDGLARIAAALAGPNITG